MVLKPSDDDPDPETVFDVLDDEACRDIVASLDGPMTAGQISEAADVPVSTAYKKLDKLESASLLTAETELRAGGHHRSRYLLDFDRLVVLLDDGGRFDVDVERELAEPERQLVGIWSEVRKET